jgi:hypothetical protein
MPRQKTGGRTKGTPNKTTCNTRAHFELLLHQNLETLQNDLLALSPRWRVHYLLELSKFVIPTLKAAEIDLTTNNPDNINEIIFTIVNENETD